MESARRARSDCWAATCTPIIVGAMRGSSTTFQVNTPNAIGAVRGTDWNNITTEDEQKDQRDCFQRTRVDVKEGTVQVCNTANPPECKDISAR